MKNFDFKKWVPHLVAVAVFLIVTVAFCKPALQSGVVLKQSDISGWQGMSHQSMEYKEQHGHYPLWLTSMFSGMPAYQVAMEGNWSPLGIIDRTIQLWLPKPMNFFFLACICFYFLCICLRIRPYAAIAGSLGFAFCSFSPIIVTAGHDTQMLALAYAPAVMGSVVLIWNRKYLLGFGLTALFTALQIGQSHQQISYYLFLVLAIMSAAFAIRDIREKKTGGLLKAIGLIAVAGMIGVAVNAISLFPAYDYAKASKRGGQLVMNENEKKGEKVINGKTTGLSKDYAFQWSYGKAETMSLMFPGVMGYGLHYAERDNEPYIFPMLKEDAHSVSYLTNLFPQAPADQIAQQMSQSVYWGDQPFTNGPVYLGAVICFLFILGMFCLDGKHKWWLLTGTVLGILLSWGSNFDAFNGFLFDHLPLYNKFRVPTMALVIPQMLVPIGASLALSRIMDKDDPLLWNKFRNGLIATAALFVLGFSFYATSDFGNENRQRTSAFNKMIADTSGNMQEKYNALNTDEKYEPKKDNNIYESWIMNLQQSPDAQKTSREIVAELRKDRASLFLRDIWMSLVFVLLAAVLIAAFIKNKVGALVMAGGVALISLIDLMALDSKYLNDKSFDSKDTYEASEFPLTAADQTIMQDKDPNFRVFNSSVSSPFEESRTSYYHKSIGGYHPAKLGIYDDLATYQMGRNMNMEVLNMLNAKYIITGRGDKVTAQRNPDAHGNAWFIKAIEFVKDPTAEMKALDHLNTGDSAVAEEEFRNLVTAFSPADSSSSIMMTSFDNDAISYESNSSANHIAVFSEIYYKDWKAYIDGKPAPYFKVNYVLRAMVVPAGKHKIDFKFEPKIFFMSRTISTVSTWLLMILLLATVVLTYIKGNKEKTAA